MKKIFIFTLLIMLMTMVFSVSGQSEDLFCLQEQANETTENCLGSQANTDGDAYFYYPGEWDSNPTHWYDGDYDTFAADSSGASGRAYMNWTPPTSAAQSGHKIFLKYGNAPYETNYTIHPDCEIDQPEEEHISIYVKDTATLSTGLHEVYCFYFRTSDNTWRVQQLASEPSRGSPLRLYEEAMYWNVTALPAELSISNISWEEPEGGFRYLDTLGDVNFTLVYDVTENITHTSLAVFSPTGVLKYNLSQPLISNKTYGSDLNIELDEVGLWTIRATAIGATAGEEIYEENFTVSNVQIPQVVDGYFGYDFPNISTKSTLSQHATYNFNIFGQKIDVSNFGSEFPAVKENINFTTSQFSRQTFITLFLDNSSGYADSTDECSALSSLSDLANFPYRDGVQFIVLEAFPDDPNATSFTNEVAICVRAHTQNQFPIYSKNVTAGLDNNYISTWDMNRINLTSDVSAYIDEELAVSRGSNELTRIYSGGTSTVKSKVAEFKRIVLDNIRGQFVGSTFIDNANVAELSNTDFIVFNEQPTQQSYAVNHTAAFGKDMFSLSLEELFIDVNDSVDITVDPYNFTVVFVDEFDKFIMTSNSTATLNYGTGIQSNEMNYTNTKGGDATLSIVGAYDARTELWNPDFGFNNLAMVSYEQLQYTQIVNFTPYDLVVIAKGANTPSIVNTSLHVDDNPDILNKTFGYISVADYNNLNSTGGNITNCEVVNEWEIEKKEEATNWTRLYGTNVFIDGFDIGYDITPSCFVERIERIANTVKVQEEKLAMFNTYTIYQQVANYGDYIMRESCFSRWNGTVGNPTYSYENFDLMLANARYLDTVNKPVVCMAFGDVNDYDKMMFDYHAFAVLYGADGQNTYRYGQPNFQVQREIRTPDFGTMLQNTWINNSATDYSRRYSKGIVHIDPTRTTPFENGKYYWFDDGQTIDSMTLRVKAQIYAASCSGGTGIRVQMYEDGTGYIGNSYDIDPCTDIGANQFDTNEVIFNITDEYQEHGHYYVTFRPINRGEATGTNLWLHARTQDGVHSWYNGGALNPPTSESGWTAYGRSGTVGDFNTTNIVAHIVLNSSSSGTVVSNVRSISQNLDFITLNDLNYTIGAVNDLALPVRGYPFTFLANAMNISYWNGTEKVQLNLVEDVSCSTNEPQFAPTNIGGEVHQACYQQNGTQFTLRVETPHLSTQSYLLDIESCEENWVPYYTECYTNDTRVLLYNDTNNCGSTNERPGDHGSVEACNYCTLSYTETTSSCVDGSLNVTYTYDNYASCCAMTNLSSDCTLPANTTQACTIYGTVGLHSSEDISAVVIDFLVEYGLQMLALAGIVALSTLFVVWANREGFFR